MTRSDIVISLRDAFDGGDWPSALEIWLRCHDLDIEELVWIWEFLESNERAFLKGEDRAYLRDYYAQS